MSSDFKQAVYDLVREIPVARVMTYGQIAAICGHPRAARVVGQLAHFGPTELPWHRVVNRYGGLARGYSYGGLEGHRKDLQREGVEVGGNYRVKVDKLIWWPDEE